MGKFRQFLTELSAHHKSIFLFGEDNLSKYRWIFTKFDVALILWRSGLGLQMVKFRHCHRVIWLPHDNGGVLEDGLQMWEIPACPTHMIRKVTNIWLKAEHA